MVLWIAFAALAAAVCLPLLLALRRAPGKGAERAAVDIYRDQLAELGRDVDRGLVAPAEAQAARAEIARRLIRADAAIEGVSAKGEGRLRNAAAIAIVAMPLAALALYLTLGSPSVPDQPLTARLVAPPSQQDPAVLLARVEQQLKAHPEDGRGWQLVAPVYLGIGRAADAEAAYRNAIRINGSSAEMEVGLGLSLVAVKGGLTDDALAAFERAVKLAPADLTPRLYLAKALEERGKQADAAAVWRELLVNAPADATWRNQVTTELARLEAAPAGPAAGNGAPAPRGPSDAEIAAAQNLPPDVRAAMIEGMIASLATRLETEPGDAQGWAQLVRSYVVLGRPDDARAVLLKAKAALVADKAKTAIVEEAARTAGLTP